MMSFAKKRGLWGLLILGFVCGQAGFAQATDEAAPPQQATESAKDDAESTDATTEAESQAGESAAAADDERDAITARVIEVAGDVQASDLTGEEWTAVAVDDELPPETQIRTGLRSSVKLQFGAEEPYTAMVIDSAGLVVISEAYKTQQKKVTRVGVGYGKIRAGVAEGGLESDFTVDSPVATLSKRGTWNFGLAYTRGTDRFEIFLLDRGLVDAINKLTQQRRDLTPGQVVTQAMRLWLDEANIRRNVAIVDVLGQEDIQVAFNDLRNSGLGVLSPGSGYENLLNLSNRRAQAQFANLVRNALGNVPPIVPPAVNRNLRPEGFFGTGRGDQLVEVFIDRNSDLAQRGLARPGGLTFRRSALEGWLQRNGGK